MDFRFREDGTILGRGATYERRKLETSKKVTEGNGT